MRRVTASGDGVVYRLTPHRTPSWPEAEEEMSTTYTLAPVTPMRPFCTGAVERMLLGAGRRERAPESLRARLLAQIRTPAEAAALDSTDRPSPLKSGIQALLGRW